MSGDKVSVLFVCLGNICRAAMRMEAARLGIELEVDSAGTGDWHVGRPPDPRAIGAGLRNGVDITGLRARQVTVEDFRRFDHVVALDRQNLVDLRRLRPPDAGARLSLLLDHVNGRAGQAVADPYHGNAAAFDETWADVTAGAKGFTLTLLAARTGPATAQ